MSPGSKIEMTLPITLIEQNIKPFYFILLDGEGLHHIFDKSGRYVGCTKELRVDEII